MSKQDSADRHGLNSMLMATNIPLGGKLGALAGGWPTRMPQREQVNAR